ncbi:MAG: hypothetical protein POELPBGB_03175 [Bacteroidia bacterium]|nr:hypothetical protein [Bacteroidia bacterium]
MPIPEDVNPQKFKVIDVLFNHDDFSISVGTWTPNNSTQIAMRWNEGEDGNGYPKVFAHPQWFIISGDVARSLLHGLLGNPLLTSVEYNSVVTALGRI